MFYGLCAINGQLMSKIDMFGNKNRILIAHQPDAGSLEHCSRCLGDSEIGGKWSLDFGQSIGVGRRK